ncbi:MAG: FkbM family methyltransferase [Flavobacteriales bacterium]|nr:FkbM family methyltransferase [Flavobacteriales bacterium]
MNIKDYLAIPIRRFKRNMKRKKAQHSNELVGLDVFMRHTDGVLHVGANEGQERQIYHEQGLKVLWIEALPDVFEKLLHNLKHYPDQTGLKYLFTDVDDKNYTFHIANNGGASSSIFDFKEHGDIWPDVKMERTIELQSRTLASVVAEHAIDLAQYQTLVMDTQGSELLVLKGAVSVLEQFRYIKTEVADFEVYAGCCTLNDLGEFLGHHGFNEVARNCFAERPEGGKCYDVLYERQHARKT